MKKRTHRCPIQAFFWLEWGLLLILTTALLSQPRSHIDFDGLLKQFPDLPWDFEIRYVVHDPPRTDMFRIYYDGRADLIHWRPTDPGSLAEVCHGTIADKQFQHLLETLRDKNFNNLPSDDEPLRTVSQSTDATLSVRLGKTIVRKTDRHQRENPKLAQLEEELLSLQQTLVADPATKCDLESVPAKP